MISLCQAVCENPFPGFTEAVPAYASLAIFYDVVTVRQNNPRFATAFESVKNYIQELIDTGFTATVTTSGKIIIPVLYNGEDLQSMAAAKNITVDELITIHTAQEYQVYMIGFLPGFAYMGSVDGRIAMPRRQVPRTLVPAGSVGIAGRQTGIYPLSSPGGWQLVGQTPVKIFDAAKPSPCLLSAGDTVRFISISKKEFDQCNEY